MIGFWRRNRYGRMDLFFLALYGWGKRGHTSRMEMLTSRRGGEGKRERKGRTAGKRAGEGCAWQARVMPDVAGAAGAPPKEGGLHLRRNCRSPGASSVPNETKRHLLGAAGVNLSRLHQACGLPAAYALSAIGLAGWRPAAPTGADPISPFLCLPQRRRAGRSASSSGPPGTPAL